MENPFEKLFKEIDLIKISLEEIKNRLPEEKEIKHYSPQDLANNTPMGVQTIRKKIKDGVINAKQFGRKYFITAEEFNKVCKEAKSLKYQRKDNRKTRYVFHNLETGNKINTKGIDDPKNIVDEMTVLKHLNSGESFVKDGEKYIVYTE